MSLEFNRLFTLFFNMFKSKKQKITLIKNIFEVILPTIKFIRSFTRKRK